MRNNLHPRNTLARHCYNCGKIFYCRPDRLRDGAGKYCSKECMWAFGNCIKSPTKGKPCTEERRQKVSRAQKGEKHWNWRGGLTPIRVQLCNTNEYRKFRTAVFERDNYHCRKCGQGSNKLNAHHLLGFADVTSRFDPNYAVTLCIKCHWLMHFLEKSRTLVRTKTRREFGEPFDTSHGNTEPSRLMAEGVETMHGAPISGEDIVQTTNA